MKTIGFIIMIIFGVSGLLVGFSIKNMADLLLVITCLCLFLLGVMMWRKRTFGALTKTSAIIMAIAAMLLFSAVLPDAKEVDHQQKQIKETAVKEKHKETENTKSRQPETTIEENTEDVFETELTESDITETELEVDHGIPEGVAFVGNSNSHVYHSPYCEGVRNIKETNRIYLYSLSDVADLGLAPAGDCQPIEFN